MANKKIELDIQVQAQTDKVSLLQNQVKVLASTIEGLNSQGFLATVTNKKQLDELQTTLSSITNQYKTAARELESLTAKQARLAERAERSKAFGGLMLGFENSPTPAANAAPVVGVGDANTARIRQETAQAYEEYLKFEQSINVLRQQQLQKTNEAIDLAIAKRQFGANSMYVLELETSRKIIAVKEEEARKLQEIEDKILQAKLQGQNVNLTAKNTQISSIRNKAADEIAKLQQIVSARKAADEANYSAAINFENRIRSIRQAELADTMSMLDLEIVKRREGANSLAALQLEASQKIVAIKRDEARQIQEIERQIIQDRLNGRADNVIQRTDQIANIRYNSANRIDQVQAPVINRQADITALQSYLHQRESLTQASINATLAEERFGLDSLQAARARSAEDQIRAQHSLNERLRTIQQDLTAGRITSSTAQTLSDSAFNDYSQAILHSNRSLNELEASHQRFNRTIGGTFQRLFELTGMWRIQNFAINSVLQGLRDIPANLIAIQQVEMPIKAIFGSLEGFNNLQFLNKLAREAGQNIQDLQASYSRFAPSAMLAGASQAEVNKIFADFTKTSTVLHLGEVQVKGLYTALEQMYAKTTVQSEEIKKQLGNALPGAVEIGAKAWAKYTDLPDKTVRGFMDAMKKNLVITKEFVPRFAEEYAKAFGGEDDSIYLSARTKLLSNLNRLKTEYFNLTSSIGQDTEGFMSGTVKKLADGLQFLSENVTGILQVSIILAGTITARLIPAMVAWAASTATATGALAAMTGVVAKTNLQVLLGRLSQLSLFVVPRALFFTGVVAAIYEVTSAITGMSVAYGKFGDGVTKVFTQTKEYQDYLASHQKQLAEDTATVNLGSAADPGKLQAAKERLAEFDALTNRFRDNSNSLFITLDGEQIRISTLFSFMVDKVKTAFNDISSIIKSWIPEISADLQAPFANFIDYLNNAVYDKFSNLMGVFATIPKVLAGEFKEFSSDKNSSDHVNKSLETRFSEEFQKYKEANAAFKEKIFNLENTFTEQLKQKQKEENEKRVKDELMLKSIGPGANENATGLTDQAQEKSRIDYAEKVQQERMALARQAQKQIEDVAKAQVASLNESIQEEKDKWALDETYREQYVNRVATLEEMKLEVLRTSYAEQIALWEKLRTGTESSVNDPKMEAAIARLREYDKYISQLGKERVSSLPKSTIVDFDMPNGQIVKDTIANFENLRTKVAAYNKEKQQGLKNDVDQATVEAQITDLTEKTRIAETNYLAERKAATKELIQLELELRDIRNTADKKNNTFGGFETQSQITKDIEASYRDQINKARSGVAENVPGAKETLSALETSKTNELTQKTIEQNKKWKDSLYAVSSMYDSLKVSGNSALQGTIGTVQQIVGSFENLSKTLITTKKAKEDLAAETQSIFNKQVDPNADNYLEQLDLKNKALELQAQKEITLDKQTTQAKLGSLSQLAGATAKFFDSKSKAAKVMSVLEQGLAAASMAIQLKQMAVNVAETVTGVAAGAAQMFAQSGWAGFAGVAAMLAVMAGLGFASGGSSAPSGAVPSMPESTGKGTVLGDSTKESTSMQDSMSLLVDIGYQQYAQLVKLNNNFVGIKNTIAYIVLQNAKGKLLNNSVTVDSLQYSGYGPLSVLQGNPQAAAKLKMLSAIDPFLGSLVQIHLMTTKLVSKIPVIGSIIGGIEKFLGEGLFGKTSLEVIANGFITASTAVSKVLFGLKVGVSEFTTIQETTKSWFSKSVKVYDILTSATSQAKIALNVLYSSIAGAMKQLAIATSPEAITNLYNAKFNSIKINLKGLSADKASAKITAVFNAEMDKLATKVFGTIYGDLQQVGEGMFATINRLYAQKTVLSPELKRLNIVFPTDTVAATRFIDTLISFSSTADTASSRLTETRDKLQAFYDVVTSQNNKNNDIQANLADGLYTLFSTISTDAAKAVSDAKIAYARAVNSLTDASANKKTKPEDLATLSTNVTTTKQTLDQANSYASSLGNLSTVFFDAYKQTGSLTDAIASMKDKLNLNTAAGQQELQILLSLASATKDYVSILDSTKQSLNDQIASIQATIDPVQSLSDLLAQLASTKDINQQKTLVAKIQKQIVDRYNTELNSINSTKSAYASISDYIKNLLLGDLSTLNPKQKLEEAKKQFDEIAATARNVTDPTKQNEAINKLQSASDNYLRIAKSYYSSTVDFVLIQQSVLQTLNDILTTTGANAADANAIAIEATKSVAEHAISDLSTLAATLTDAAIKSMQDSVNQVQTQTETQTGTTNTTTATETTANTPKTSNQQTATTLDSLFSQLYSVKAGSTEATNFARQIKAFNHGGQAEYEAEVLRESLKAQLALVKAQAKANPKDKVFKEKIKELQAQIAVQNSKISFKASGGPASGLTVVGENGWELLNLPTGSKVSSNTSSQSILANAGKEQMDVLNKIHLQFQELNAKIAKVERKLSISRETSKA